MSGPLKMRGAAAPMLAVFFVCLLAAGAWYLFAGQASRTPLGGAGAIANRLPNGGPQLISIDPLPETDGEMCKWVTKSASGTLLAALEQTRAAKISAPDHQRGASTEVDRAPLRVIRDTYPTYSAIAVDTRTNETFLLDENLFGLKVFNRLDNTPPGTNFTEPKRVLGGIKTKLEFNCGLYVDPKAGDIYAVANDTGDTLLIFAHDAQGDVPPIRELKTPHRTYGIAVDEKAQELFLTVQYAPQVVVYRKQAAGSEKPIRTLEGEHTKLRDVHGIALDAKNGWMFVSNHGSDSKWDVPGTGKFNPPSITVYPLKANGDTPPLRVIEGPKTLLNWPAAMSVDMDRGELFVANDADDSVLVFPEDANGDVAPLRILKGSQTGIKNPTGVFVDTKNRELWVSNMGNHSATVYAVGAGGNAAPLRTIRSAPVSKVALAIGNPGAVAYDSKRQEILVPN
jgi:hypothetical protein